MLAAEKTLALAVVDAIQKLRSEGRTVTDNALIAATGISPDTLLGLVALLQRRGVTATHITGPIVSEERLAAFRAS